MVCLQKNTTSVFNRWCRLCLSHLNIAFLVWCFDDYLEDSGPLRHNSKCTSLWGFWLKWCTLWRSFACSRTPSACLYYCLIEVESPLFILQEISLAHGKIWPPCLDWWLKCRDLSHHHKVSIGLLPSEFFKQDAGTALCSHIIEGLHANLSQELRSTLVLKRNKPELFAAGDLF